MRAIRRIENAPRIEMTPLLDVVLLLLTFFIYSVSMMVNAEVLPLRLVRLNSGQQARGSEFQVITVDRAGGLYFNKQPMTLAQLDQKISELGKRADHPPLYLTMEEEGSADRGPVLLSVIEQVRAAGIVNFALVGRPGEAGPHK
jgi:biopolymer transport protein ExbD